jgi:acyl-CoA-binding protein
MGKQLMGRAMGDEYGVAGRQCVRCPVLHPQHRIADRQEVKPGMPRFVGKAQAEGWTGLDTPVLDATQAHCSVF